MESLISAAILLLVAVWLFAGSRAITPILWVSVSYITLFLRRIQDIIPPDIARKNASISGYNTRRNSTIGCFNGKCPSVAEIAITITEIIRQQVDPHQYNGKYP